MILNVNLDTLFNAEAERAVLGACVFSKEALHDVAEILVPGDFYDRNNRIAYRALLEMVKTDAPIDFISVSEEFQKCGIFESLGGMAFLAELIKNITTTANVVYHAEIVRSYSFRRRIADSMYSIFNKVYDFQAKDSDVMEEIEKRLFDAAQDKKNFNVQPVENIMPAYLDYLEDIRRNGVPWNMWYKSGFLSLDYIINGFKPGSLNIIAARPSMGKTALALNIAQFGGAKDKTVLFFSLEMSAKQLTQRMFAAQAESFAGPTLHQLEAGVISDEDMKQLKMMRIKNIFISDTPSLTATDFVVQCRKFKMKHKSISLVVVDYLQLMNSGNKNAANRQYEMAEISRMMKTMAMELDCPIIALSQLSRETERRVEKKPQLSDLRDSGAIEQDADTVMLLYREDYYTESDDPKSKAEIRVAKNRNGQTGKCCLTFKREYAKFVEVESIS